MAVTIKEIAEQAGVCFQAVSAVLNGKAGVTSAKTRQKILQIAQDLNYHPNVAARALSSGKTKLIGLITQDIRFPFHADLSYQVQAAAERRGYKVLMLESNWDNNRTQECLNTMLSYSIDGILMIGNVTDKSIYQGIIKKKIPMVFIDGKEEGFSGHEFNYRPGMKAAFEHLIQAGIRRIAMADDAIWTRKKEMYIEIAAEFGITPQVFNYRYPTVGGEAQLIECGRQIARAENRPEALIIGADYDAALIIQGLAENGIKIPEDISLIAIDDTFMSRLSNPPLSAILLDREKTANLVVEKLEKKINNPDLPPEQMVVDTLFVDRSSIKNRNKI